MCYSFLNSCLWQYYLFLYKGGIDISSGILAILDYEPGYADHLMDYLNRKKNFKMQVRAFTNKESLCSFLSVESIDILLIADGIVQEDIPHENIKNIVILSEGRGECVERGQLSVYKFQSSDHLIQEVMDCCMEQEEEDCTFLQTGERTKLAGVLSGGECGYKTAFSLALGIEFAKVLKTLYIDFSVFSALPALVDGYTDRGLSEVIYFSKEKNSHLALKAGEIIQSHHGLDLIGGADHPMDLYELDAEDIWRILRELADKYCYQMIIVEIGLMNEVMMELLEQCDVIFNFTDNDKISREKDNGFMRMLEMEGRDSIKNKLKRVSVPVYIYDTENEAGVYEYCREKAAEYTAGEMSYGGKDGESG